MGVAMTRQHANQYAYDVAVVGLGPVGELGALLWHGRACACSHLSDKPICTAAPAWAFSTVKRCAHFRRRVCTTALLQT